ncbi:MAG: hypothetical protein LBQ22_01295 [Bacteroidales bacterium]|jgi:hypothetical protein|nr:hypothetical protein [Bacteroidales bacterium]
MKNVEKSGRRISEIFYENISDPDLDDQNRINENPDDWEVLHGSMRSRSYKNKDRKYKHFERRRMGDNRFNQKSGNSLAYD